MAIEVGTLFRGRYRIAEEIGMGGMGQVFRALDVEADRPCALKVLRSDLELDAEMRKRFSREANIAKRLRHEHVADVFDAGVDETTNVPFIVFELLEGKELGWMAAERGPLPPEEVSLYLWQTAKALEEAHRQGIVHRDLKPANIMFRGDDSLALADFGISKKIRGQVTMTTIGQVLGTPHYMSPEQGEGFPVDHRTDLYSAGVMLFELLSGEKPYTAQTPAALIYQHVHADIPQLPAGVAQYQEIIDRTLAKDPAARYQTARELIHVLEQAEKDFN